MTTIKSYTDISQSKKLAEFLPLESADMYYSSVPVREWKASKGTHVVFKDRIFALENLPNGQIGEGDTYAWSLAALLGVFDNKAGLAKDYDLWFCYDNGKSYCTKHYINAIDACYEMILKLNELNLL